jgi:hypothetical protein
MSAEKDPAGSFFPQSIHRAAKALAIAGSHPREGRPVRSRLAERQVAAQHQKAFVGKSGCDRKEQLRLAVCAGAMSQDQSIAVGILWQVQKTADSRFSADVR